MTLSHETLKQRLKYLEDEQNRQDWILEREMTHLKTELTQRDADNISSAKVRPLRKINLPAVPTKLSVSSPKVATAVKLLTETKETKVANPSSTIPPSSQRRAVTSNYVIQLTLHSQRSVEWSGKGWAKCGQGRHYPTLEQAQKSLHQLQKHWSADQLKIVSK